MDADERHSVEGFVDLVEALLAHRLVPNEFESRFFALWARDRTPRSPEVFAVLERFFFVVEDHVDDPELRDEPGDLDEERLRAGARRFLDDVARL